MSSGSAKSLFLSVPSRLDALGPIRGRVLDYVGQLGFAEQAAEDLVLCVHEAVSNAIVHGNREAEELPVDVLIEALDGGVRPGFAPHCAVRYRRAAASRRKQRASRCACFVYLAHPPWRQPTTTS